MDCLSLRLDLPERPVQRAGRLVAAKLPGGFLEASGLLFGGLCFRRSHLISGL